MAKLHSVRVNGQLFQARSGQTILEAALTQGVDVPHDCRAGRCGTCLMRLERGHTVSGETGQPGHVHACQARVFSELELSYEPTPPVVSLSGEVASVTDLAEDVVELKIGLAAPLVFFPGQYARVAFRGFPMRCYSPTVPLDGRREVDGSFRLNIRRIKDGRVSSALGREIRRGHGVTIEGPFGAAFFRPNETRRLVLVAGGTGFAPIWSIADAALRENPLRRMVIVAGVRRLKSLYMAPALALAQQMPNVTVIGTADDAQSEYECLRRGPPDRCLPPLTREDVVHAAGSPALVDSVSQSAMAVGARFHADPFEDAAQQDDDWLARAFGWLKTG
jgi:3-phenylpropionate/trans-cinnamate dioxygenase ferredoxin reductase subunit